MSSRENVTIVVSGLLPTYGLESATLSLSNALNGTHDVSVVYLADTEHAIPDGTTFPVRSWGSKVGGLRRISTVPRAFSHRNEMGHGVFILSGVWVAIPMLLAMPRSVRTRTIVWEHSLGSEQVKSSRRLRLLRAIAKKLYQRAFAVVVVSDSLRRDLMSDGFQGEIIVIPNLIREISRSTKQPVNCRLLTIGALKPNKNQALALRTLALLPQRYSIDIVGAGPELESLQRLSVELGIDARVTFHGHTSNPDVYFARAQYVVHPSLGETYGMVFFEAAESERPVVAANQSVMPDLIPHLIPGVVTEPTPEAFAAAILRLEGQPIQKSTYIEAAERRESISRQITVDWQRVIKRASHHGQ